MRLLKPVLAAVVVLWAVAAAPAAAVVPENAVGGAGSKWFSGSLIQQPGTNCSIIGQSYPEIMVSGIGSYGGRPGVVKVGDEYWTALLLAVPGNPCGTGSSAIATDLILPRSTQIDGSRPIRCFYLSRNATNVDQFSEVTGQTWSAFGSSGEICPAQATPSARHAGAVNVGFRPLPNGAQLQIFVPVKSTGTLLGSGGPDKFSWLTDATGVYANPGLSEVWSNVFATAGAEPFVYFAREPSAVPFWKADAQAAPVDLRNRTEFFANFNVAGRPGNVTFAIHRTDTAMPTLVVESSNAAAGWNPAVPAGLDLIQVMPFSAPATGPNGGYAPFAWDAPGQNGNPFPNGEWDTPMRITWTFTPSPGNGPPVSGTQTFRTLAGPDTDADGVADLADACPATKGTEADGCLPSAPPDPDGDGVFGALDRCPGAAAPGVLDGCPAGGVTPGPGPGPVPPHQLVATTTLKRNARLKPAALKKGAKVAFTCSQDATATVTLIVAGKVAKRLGARRLARTTGACSAARGGSVRLKPTRAVLRKLGRLRKPVAAKVTVALAAAGATAGTVSTAVRLG